KNYSAFCRKNNIRLFIVMRPDLIELDQQKYRYDFSEIKMALAGEDNLQLVDLFSSYKQYSRQQGKEEKEYYWPKDGHHNPCGYEMMARTTYEKISPVLHAVYIEAR